MALIAGLFWALWMNRADCLATDFVLDNWKVILGLPFISLAAFIVVALFRQPSEPMEFSAIGLQFKGSAGEVVLWVLCFIAMVGAVKLLGDPDSTHDSCRIGSADIAEPTPAGSDSDFWARQTQAAEAGKR